MIVIAFGAWALSAGQGDLGRAFTVEPPGDRGLFQAVMAGTTLAFFAMVGFEDSVNMAEESKNPTRIFPKVLIGGLTAAAAFYLLVSVVAMALLPAWQLAEADPPLLQVVAAGAPGFPLSVSGGLT